MAEQSERKTYAANCHCGAIQLSLTISPPLEAGHEVTKCNCSICVRNGYHLVYVPKADVTFEKGGEEDMTVSLKTTVSAFKQITRLLCDMLIGTQSYSFGMRRVVHLFCKTCGTHVGGRSIVPDFIPDIWAVNVSRLSF